MSVSARKGSVAAGRDVVAQLVVTGDRNVFFCGSYQPLGEAYIDPWQVFERARLHRFVGRQWLERELDLFLAEADRGYFIIEAKAGLGKTAFLAQLVRKRGWIHHFVEQAPGADGVVPARKNLAAQVLRAFELKRDDHMAGLPDQAASRPDFLATLLRDAAAQRRPGERIVIVVDGLDEAGARPGENVLGLPRVLPEGVYFVCSARPVPIDLYVEHRRPPAIIEPQSKENEADLRAFLEGVCASSEAVRGALNAQRYLPSQFVDALVANSGGVWIYLHYLIAEIEQGQRTLDLDALPEGLWDYYYGFWHRWKEAHPAQWRSEQLPLLAALAAVRSAVPLELLGAFAGLDQAHIALPERWLPFVSVEDAKEPRHRLYHKSLEDFLRVKVEANVRGEIASRFSGELALATHEAHTHIVNHYLKSWGGLDAGLPALRNDTNPRQADQRYGLRHIVDHMLCSHEGDARRLLTLECVTESTACSNVWFAAHDESDDIAGYLSDIGLAWRHAQAATKLPIDGGQQTSGPALEYGYALITSRVNALARRIPSALRVALVRCGIWSLERAIADVRQLALNDSMAALGELGRGLPGAQGQLVFVEALELLRRTEDGQLRRQALAGLAPNLPEGLLLETLGQDRVTAESSEQERARRRRALSTMAHCLPTALAGELLELTRSKTDEIGRTVVLAEVAHRLPDELVGEALEMTVSLKDELLRAQVLAQLAPRLSESERESAFTSVLSAVLEGLTTGVRATFQDHIADDLGDAVHALPHSLVGKALDIARAFDDEYARATLLIALVPRLSEGTVGDALEISREGTHGRLRALTLAELATRLPPEARQTTLAEAITTARAISDERFRVETLAELAPMLEQSERKAVFAEALDGAQAITTEYLRAWALYELAPRVPDEQMPRVLELAGTVADEGLRTRVLALLAPRVPEGMMDEVLEMTQEIGGEASRTTILAQLAPRLPKALMSKALEVARASGYESPHAMMLSEIALRLPPEQRQEALAAAEGVALTVTGESSRDVTLRKIALRTPDELLGFALDIAGKISSESERSHALRDLAPRLSYEQLEEALRALGAFHEAPTRARVLEKLAAHLPETLLSQALEIARAIPTASDRASVLAMLAPKLPEDLARSALDAAFEIADPHGRALVLGELAEKLPEDERGPVLEQFEASERAVHDEPSVGQMLSGIFELLSEEGALPDPAELEELSSEEYGELDMDHLIAALDRSGEALTLAMLASHLPERERERKFDEVLCLVNGLSGEPLRASTLVEIMPYVPDTKRKASCAEALSVVGSLNDESERSRLLVQLVPELATDLMPEMFAAARSIADEQARVAVLVALAPKLPEALAEQMFELVSDIAYEPARAELLSALTPRLSERQIREAFELVRSIAHHWARGWALEALAPRLPEELMPDALELTRELTDLAYQAGALARLVPHLPARLVGDALELAGAITNQYSLQTVLRELVPRCSVEQIGDALELTRRIHEEPFRLRLLDELVLRTVDTDRAVLHCVWSELLAALVAQPDIAPFASAAIFDAMAAFGGEQAICEAREWVNRVWRWWP